MPSYLYVADDGEETERVFPMSDAPPIGSTIQVDGKIFKRVSAIFWGGFAMSQARKGKYPYLSNSLPRTLSGCKVIPDPKTGRPKPLIESARHERNVMAENDLVKGGTSFDTAD